jgi:uncharacterized membrane protein
MASPTGTTKHPVHLFLILFPVGLWVFSLVCDLIYAMKWGGAVWNEIAFYAIAAGIGGALLATAPGAIDLTWLPGPEVKSSGKTHMAMLLAVISIFTVNLWLRTKDGPGTTLPVVLSAIGAILLFISGWFGNEVVDSANATVAPLADMSMETVEDAKEGRVA